MDKELWDFMISRICVVLLIVNLILIWIWGLTPKTLIGIGIGWVVLEGFNVAEMILRKKKKISE